MILENVNVIQGERFDVQEGGIQLGKRIDRQPKPATASSKSVSAQPTPAVEPEPETSLQHSDDLDAARGMLLGIVSGAVLWGLIGGAVYLLFF